MSTVDLVPVPTRPRLALPSAIGRLPRLALPTVGLLLLTALIVVQAAHGFTDPDYWWHVKTGEVIVSQRSIPHLDVFSATAAGRPWVTHEWLAEVLIYGLVRAGGYGTALAVFTLSPLLSVLLLARLLDRERVGPRAALPILALSTVIIAIYTTVRPQVLSWLMFSLLLYALYGYRAGRIRRLWALPLLFLVWANLHLSFLVGLAIFGVFVAATAGAQVVARQRIRISHLLLVLVGSVAAACVNPNGVRLLVYPLSYLPLQKTLLPALEEWKSPDFHSLLFAPFLAAIGLLLITGINPKKLDLWSLGLGLLVVALALQSARYVAVFGVAFVPIAGLAMRERWPWAIAQTAESPTPARAALHWALLAAAIGVFALTFRPAAWSQFQGEPRTAGQGVPVDAVNLIQKQFPNAHVFNQYEWGGYLIYRLWPQQRPFIDGRGEMFPPAFLAEYLNTYAVKPGWEGTLDRYGVDLVLIRSDSPLAGALETNPRWRLVHQDELATIYTRV
jgi:hypothetical protein